MAKKDLLATIRKNTTQAVTAGKAQAEEDRKAHAPTPAPAPVAPANDATLAAFRAQATANLSAGDDATGCQGSLRLNIWGKELQGAPQRAFLYAFRLSHRQAPALGQRFGRRRCSSYAFARLICGQ